MVKILNPNSAPFKQLLNIKLVQKSARSNAQSGTIGAPAQKNRFAKVAGLSALGVLLDPANKVHMGKGGKLEKAHTRHPRMNQTPKLNKDFVVASATKVGIQVTGISANAFKCSKGGATVAARAVIPTAFIPLDGISTDQHEHILSLIATDEDYSTMIAEVCARARACMLSLPDSMPKCCLVVAYRPTHPHALHPYRSYRSLLFDTPTRTTT